jgi:hypothetical protein
MHLFTVPVKAAPVALARMAWDRRALRRTAGCRFWKLLGTGDGRTFDVRDADPAVWGLLAVWSSPRDLLAFERDSPVASGWRRLAVERWRADLVPLRSRGTWSGRRPFEPQAPFEPHTPEAAALPAAGQLSTAGPVAAITRARLRAPRMRTFLASVPEVNATLHRQPGLRFSIGIGEAPVGLQGTLSVWDSPEALRAFAYRGSAHRRVMERSEAESWYAEELFARFALLGTTGTVGGADPADAPALE